MSLIKIEFKNWEKFNPRSDRANYTWFRLQNSLFSDQKIFGLNHSQIALYLFLLCEASKCNCGAVDLSPAYICALLKYDEGKLYNDIKVLNNAGLMTSNSQPNDGKQPTKLPATNERTNVTNERDVCSGGVKTDSMFDRKELIKASKEVQEKPKSQLIKETYCGAFKKRYGIEPKWAAKENTLAKRLVESVGFDEAAKLSSSYLDYPDPWHVKQKHPFSLLVAQVDKIRVELNDPRRMFDEHNVKKQLTDRAENAVLESRKRQLEREIEEEAAQICSDGNQEAV